MKIKKTSALIIYWIIALTSVAAILISLDYSFGKALFLSTLYLPAAVAAKFFSAQIKWDGSAASIRNGVFLFCSIAVFEFLLVMTGHLILNHMDPQGRMYYDIGIANIMVNPVFGAAMILLLIGGEFVVSRKYKDEKEDSRISFTSDRHKVILDRNEIIYAESNDSEVWIYATEGRRFRNKTGITQWGNVLGEDFIRVHRSYLVRKTAITSIAKETITLSDGTEIPVSRKYRDELSILVKN